MAKEFDPTITSLGYCDPKTYPRDGKRLPAVRVVSGCHQRGTMAITHARAPRLPLIRPLPT